MASGLTRENMPADLEDGGVSNVQTAGQCSQPTSIYSSLDCTISARLLCQKAAYNHDSRLPSTQGLKRLCCMHWQHCMSVRCTLQLGALSCSPQACLAVPTIIVPSTVLEPPLLQPFLGVLQQHLQLAGMQRILHGKE